MFYPAVDYLVIILLLAFLMVTLFACIFCLRHEYIRKESEKRKRTFQEKELNITEFSWFRYNQHNETGINITMDKTIIVMVAVNGRMFSKNTV